MSDPVYQIEKCMGLWDDTTKEEFDRSQFAPKRPVRMLYPAAAYEALQKENAELQFKAMAAISPRVKQSYEREIKGLEDQIEAQAKLIEALETLCTHDYESKDDFILRVKEKLKNGDSK